MTDNNFQEERRWRLILGRFSEKSLTGKGLSGTDLQIQQALDYLYDREYQGRKLKLDTCDGGIDESQLTALDWLEKLPELFPQEVCETLQQDALERYALTELLQDPNVLKKLEPDQRLLKNLLMLKGKMSAAVLEQLRSIIRKVVDDITRQLKPLFSTALSGRRNRFARSQLKTIKNLDWKRTIRANLKHYQQDRQHIVLEKLYFQNRIKKRLPWDIILCVDQSASMAESVLYSAIISGILAALPGVSVKLIVFDTAVVDLSNMADDPVEILMSVQLGGGTDIAKAMAYCAAQVVQANRSVIALISDFYEGGHLSRLLHTVHQLHEARITLLGLAALDNKGTADFDRGVATQLAQVGMQVAAMSPGNFAHWLVEVMEQP